MAIFSKLFKGTIKTVADVPSWLGYSSLKESTTSLWRLIKGNFTVRKASRQENFSQAMQRLHLTEEDLQARANFLMKQTLGYLLISCVILTYFAHLIVHFHIVASILCFLLATLFIVKTWETHFWYFQIKHRKLGCGFKEWLNALLGRQA